MYEVVRTIAVGHQGVVQLAKAPNGDLVAIKRLHQLPTSQHSRAAAQRFVREAELLGELKLPNVVPLLEVIEDDDQLALVMPYLEGGSLHDRVVNRGVLSSQEVIALAVPLLQTLASLHRQGIVHRDLKPANILFDRTGSVAAGEAIPYLIDFGIGYANDFTVGLSDAGQVLGTPAFMAPERARGEAASAASDIYSLGATLRFALTGMSPHGIGDVHTLVRRAEAAQVEPLPTNVDPSLAALLNQMCVREPEARPTAAALMSGPFGTLVLPDQTSTLPSAAAPNSPTVGITPATAKGRYRNKSTGTTHQIDPPVKARGLPGHLYATAGVVIVALLALTAGVLATSKNRSSEAAEFTPTTQSSGNQTQPGASGPSNPDGETTNSSTLQVQPTTTTETECIPKPYQGCDDPQPARGTDGEACLPGFYDHDDDPTNGCEATRDPSSELRLERGSVTGTIIPVGNVDKVLVPVTDQWQLLCDGVLTLTLTAPSGLDLEMTVFNRGSEMFSFQVPGSTTKSTKIGEPSCFTNDSTTLEVIIRGVRGRSSAPWTLERSGSW